MRQPLIIVALCIISPLLLASCWWQKDETGTLIDPATQKGENSPYTYAELEAMFSGANDKVLDASYTGVDSRDISNHLAGGTKDIKSLIDSLTGSDTESVEKKAYLKSYMGDYSGAIAEREALCQKDPTNCGKRDITISIDSMVDSTGKPISGPNIYLNSKKIEAEGAITQAEVYDNMVHRVRVEKEGYLDSFAKINGVEGVDINFNINPVMTKAASSISMDNQVGGTYSVGSGTGQITYTIAPDTFTDSTGKIIQGQISVYLFSLGNESQDLSIFGLDTFTPDGVSIGSSMVTDGMPFVTAYYNGAEALIAKPIEGVGTMELNQTFTVDLESVPKNTWLGNKELQEYGLPGYWKLDRRSGVWIESKMQILDATGRYKFNFQ